MIRRGDVWLVRLDPVEGSEQGSTRPCVVVSPPEASPYRISTIVPLTTKSRKTRFRPPIHFLKDGLALVDQARTVSHLRMIKRLGQMDDATLTVVLATLREMFED
ncbi:MAG: type II toxin-antitoxin system PemK/MazF family toxin [Brevundimonas sp.]|uniref:type II toxin-antitoxin system PemK/MazF family toxin n=1 Tax=Brevundimonas sp. TaxID=1871086 RepID=UPI002735E596|nr:type II toxin-antitoxin system PemK/MazF family toxin [Brevundimonas sp.]MDP3656767.1 type II toxin-antitoxin system PemK/MazF family toxin [Brevundimonas sp.]